MQHTKPMHPPVPSLLIRDVTKCLEFMCALCGGLYYALGLNKIVAKYVGVNSNHIFQTCKFNTKKHFINKRGSSDKMFAFRQQENSQNPRSNQVKSQ